MKIQKTKEYKERQSKLMKRLYAEGIVKSWNKGKKCPQLSKKGEKHPMYGRRGKDNPNYGKARTEEVKRKISIKNKGILNGMYNKTSPKRNKTYEEFYGKTKAKEVKEKLRKSHIGYKRTKESRLKQSESTKGEKNWNWRGGYTPYGVGFTEFLKEQIRERDNYTCQECKYPQEKLKDTLHVHHIDYDKNNHNPENLIALCSHCHLKTNFNRDNWKEYYQNKMLCEVQK